MRFRRLCTAVALGVSLLTSSGCFFHRCCCHRPFFHRRMHCAPCDCCCGAATCCFQPACDCGAPVPIGTAVPPHPAPVAPVPLGTAVPAPTPVAPLPAPTIVNPSH